MAYVGKITDTNGVTGPVGSTLYGTCDTAAATVAKVVTCADFDKLITGVTIHVKFTNNNTSTNPTMDVNSTGAKRIYRYGTTSPSTSSAWSWYAGAVVSFTYDGSAWIMNDMIGNDNTYDRTSIQMRIYAGTNGVFPYSIVALDKNQRMQAMTTTGGTATTKVFNSSQKFLYPPYIYYHSENATRANGAVISNNVLYEQFPNVDMRYSCNITSSAGFTQYKPIYIECTIDDDGYWSPTGITQTFTSGKYYILLGVTYSTSIYQLALTANHPVFYYNGTDLVPADFGSQNITSGSQTFHPILAGPNHSGTATFDTGCSDILDYTSDIYSDTTNRTALFMKRVCASDGGALVANNYSVASVWGTPNPSNPSADDLLAARTGAVISGSAYRHQTRGENNERYIGDIIRGYAGKSNTSGTGQLVGVGGSGLTMVCGGPIINTLADAIADDQSVSEPARLNLYQDTAGDDITDVGAGLFGRTQSLILGSSKAIFLVGITSDGERRRGVYFNPGLSTSSAASLSPAENNAVNLGATGHRWANAYINTLFGSLDSSVTAVTQTPLDNSTKVATTEYVDSLANRYGRANYNQVWPDPDPTNVWAKVAHCTVEVTSASQNLVRRTTFLVSQRLNDNSKRVGILTIGSTTNAANDTSLEASWLAADPGIDPENYVIVSTDTNVSSTTRTSNIELWVKWTSGNEYILFKPLIEHIIGATRIVWTFDEPTASDGQAAYTVGTTTVVSSLATLKNDISGNADTATNATNADNLKPDTINPSSATTYYPLFQTSGTTSAKKAYYNTGLSYITNTGTSSEAGLARLRLGYGSSSTSTSDKGGEIVMYSTARNQYTVTIKPDELSGSNKTLTLPNKSGTVAVTSDIPDIDRGGILYFSSAGAKWGRVASLVTTSTSTFVLLLSVSQGLGNETSSNHYKAAGILQMACNTSSAGTINSNNNSLLWLVAGGNISSSNFVLVGYNNSKYGSDGKTITTQSGSAVFELWVKNTANYHVWGFKPLQENHAATFTEIFTFYNPRNADAVDNVPTGTINKVSGFFAPVTS